MYTWAATNVSRALKRYVPQGLFGRTLLILIVPIVILQGLVSYLYVERHYDRVSRQLSETVARELSYIIDEIERTSENKSIYTLMRRFENKFKIRLDLDEESILNAGINRGFYDLAGNAVGETLEAAIHRPLSVDLSSYQKIVDIRIQTRHGVLRALTPRKHMIAERPHLLLVWTGIVSFSLIVIAVLFLRNQIRPIRQLAKSAEAFGRGQNTLPDFRPSGALEIRQAARAFIQMRARIERAVEQRTQMLLGISHDLRTPLTRMKLTLAMEEETEGNIELSRDVLQMEHMINAFLDFGQKQNELTQKVSLQKLLETVLKDTQRGNPTCRVTLQLCEQITVETTLLVKPYAFQRCLHNLLENACVFGDTVLLTARITKKWLEFTVEDNGCGIPEQQRDEAFRSFNRLDNARNQNKVGGVGLGLTIARDIVHSHGGHITLDESISFGGLKVIIVIPQ